MMEYSFAKAPPEILSVIFTHLEKRDVMQCQLTCKNWNRPAQEQLYKKVDNLFTKHNNESLITTFFNTLMESPNGLGNHVKTIYFDDLFCVGYFTNSKREEYMENLVKLCPNVENLLAFGKTDVDDIMFWRHVVSSRRNCHWNRVKWLPSPHNFSYPDYVNAVLGCSDKLESLHIICLSPRYRGGLDIRNNHSTQLNRLIDKLGEFTNLKHVYIDEVYGYNDDIYRFDYIIDKCPPSLKSYDFHNNSLSLPAPPSRTDLYDTTITAPHLRSNANIKELGTNNFWKLNKDSVDYMMCKFPNLEKVCFGSTWESYFRYPKQTAVDFFKFISGVPKFNLGGCIYTVDDANITALVDNFMVATTNNLATTPVNVKLLYRQYHESDFAYYDPSLIDFFGLNFVKVKSYESGSEIEHKWATTSKERSYNLDIQIDKRPDEISTSRESFNERLLRASGSRINQLYYSPGMKFMPDLKYLRDAQNQITVTKNGLDPILKYCTSLVNLDLSWMRLSRGPQRAPVINRSIKNLRFENCSITEDALTALSIRLPALKNLVIKDCIFVKNHDYPVIFNMNNTSFESLTLHFMGTFKYALRKRGSNLIMKVTSTANGDNKIQYLMFNMLRVQVITSEAYSVSLSGRGCLSLELLCKEISLLSVKLDNLPQVDHYFNN